MRLIGLPLNVSELTSQCCRYRARDVRVIEIVAELTAELTYETVLAHLSASTIVRHL